MTTPVLLVEERLRVALLYLDALKGNALLMTGSPERQPFGGAEVFAEWVAGQSLAITGQIVAVKAVLPSPILRSPAPFIGPEGI